MDTTTKEDRQRHFLEEAVDWVEWGVTVAVFMVLIFTFAIRMVWVDGESMLPTLEDRSSLVVTRLAGDAKPYDIVAMTKPNASNKPLIKRVIAVEGQTIDIDFDTGDVYVDGARLSEPYIAEPIDDEPEVDNLFPQVVPEGCAFLMGDNRNNSWDSRTSAVGMVDQRYILGKVVVRVTPLSDFGPVE